MDGTIGRKRDSHPLNWPDEGLTRVPYHIYAGDDLYRAEQQRIFRGPTWNYLCLACEIPAPGDWVTSFVGDTPVIVTRDKDGAIHAMENRCSHRGALVCLEKRGNDPFLTCVYHCWSYRLDGRLRGVAFERGIEGKGGLPADFDKGAWNLRTLRVAEFCGLVFGTCDAATPPLEDHLGEEIVGHIRRILPKPLVLLGVNRQYLNNNWKIYGENLRDSYHASLLHTFFNTFKLNRLSQEGGIVVSPDGGHHLSYGKRKTLKDDAEYAKAEIHSSHDDFALSDPSLLDVVDEDGLGISTNILSVFPSVGLQKHYNSIAVRHVLPKGPGETELIWNYVGFADDDADMTARRVKQANLVGPAGYISMEDGCIGEFVQRGIAGSEGEISIVEMGGGGTESQDGRATEVSIRGFWKAYRRLMAS